MAAWRRSVGVGRWRLKRRNRLIGVPAAIQKAGDILRRRNEEKIMKMTYGDAEMTKSLFIISRIESNRLQ